MPNTVRVNLNYRNANDNVDAYFYLNAILLEKIEVTTAPNKTVYRYGETIDYTGMAVTATYKDGSTKDITDVCTISPRNGSAFDGSSVEIGYSEGRDEQSCSFSLTSLALSQLVIVSMPSKTSYKLGEAINYSGLSLKAVYTDNSEADVTASCVLSPAEGKLFNLNEDTHVSITYSEGETELSKQITLTPITMALQIVSAPAKTAYKYEERIDYSGIVVKAVFSDGTEKIVTNDCTFSSAQGKAFDPEDDTSVVVTYTEIRNGVSDTQTSTLTFTPINLNSISVTSNPTKTSYKYGEAIDYTGLIVTASYSDGTTENITSSCTITPVAGKAFNPQTDTSVEITYAEGAGQQEYSASLFLTEISLSSIAVTSNPTKTSYKYGEAIDYTGLVVTASYSDGSTEDITASCSISPAEGKAFDPATDTNVEISYSEGAGQYEYSVSLLLTEISLISVSVTSNPNKAAYKSGEAITYSGLVVTASYSDGTTEDVTNSCIVTPSAGKTFNPATDSSAEISYMGNSVGSIMLTEIYLTGLQITTNPTKTAYKHDESISYAGMVVTASYSDNSSSIVTSRCTITPASDKKFDAETDTYVDISYSEGNYEATCTLTLTPITLTSLQVTTNPTKTAYTTGENISYSGIVVTASYSDNSTSNVTESCTFSPQAGKAFNPTTDTSVTITYSEGQSEQTCTLTLTEASESSITLTVATMPTKTAYKQGDTLDYTGVVIKAVHQDGTEHTVTDYCEFSPANGSTVSSAETKVTVKCAPPATPYVFDQNSGYVDNGVWKYELPTNTYIDIYEVSAGHKYLLTLGSTVGSRFRAMFTTTDVSKASSNVSGTKIINVNNPAAYASVEYTPSSNGYIVVGKDNVGKTGVKTYLYDGSANSSDRTVTTEFTLTAPVLSSIAVTRPVKTRYRSGEKYDYTGAIVTAHYSDGTIVNVTNDAVFSPAAGTTVTSNNPASVITSPVSVSYTDGITKTTSFNVTKGGVAIVSLSLTPPDKTLYYVGDTIDYTGCKVTAVYWDGSTQDVTSSALFSPAAGTTVSKWDLDENNNLVVSVSYQEIDEVLASNVSIDDYDYDKEYGYDSWYDADYSWYTTLYATIESIDVSTGQTQTQTFSADVSEYCDFPESIGYNDYYNPQSGRFDKVHLKAAIPKWPEQRGGQVGFVLHLYHNLPDPHLVSYVDYYGEKYFASYYVGEEFLPFMTAYYDSHASYSFNLSVITLQDELSLTPPTKTTYHYGEALDYTGCVAIAQYSNGDTLDVTASARFSPAAGTNVTSSRTVWVSYSNEGDEYAENSFSVTVIRLSGINITPPTKTSYHSGETIDYAGVAITAKYSDGSTEDVTSSAVFSPPAGTEITDTVNVSISYTNSWNETATGSLSLSIE